MSNTKEVTITFTGEAEAGKSLLIAALQNYFSVVLIPFEMIGEHEVKVTLQDHDRNALADFIIMRESQRSN